MSERICLLLLRLYPAQFRRSYGDEALLLFRDRMRDETGAFERARLWFDLLVDLLNLHVRGYREASVRAASSVHGGVPGVPLFESLEETPPGFGFLLRGGVASLLLCGAALYALQYGRGNIPPDWSMSGRSSLFAAAGSKRRPVLELTSEAADPADGSVVRIRAVVMPRETGPMPTGTVDFFYRWKVVGRGRLVDGSVTIDAKLPDDKRVPMSAVYIGDINYMSARSFEPVR